ncbi:MAG TPA: VOC family protein, partial [Anaeromyxobacteraceae bacterium]|nr:VOC family protein [Anaeromyxobacteraceae bacterium]
AGVIPPPSLGLRHVALRVRDLPAVERFFVDALGYRVEWRPDPENVYLTRDEDNVALHAVRAEGQPAEAAPRLRSPSGGTMRGLPGPPSMIDHLGIFVARAEDVDAWERHLDGVGARIVARPKTHRDGARSLYVEGPEGLVVQVLHHPRAFARPSGD